MVKGFVWRGLTAGTEYMKVLIPPTDIVSVKTVAGVL